MDPKDLIKEKLDIVDVIREFLPLKPAGSNWKGLCPFHKEKTPSFMVSPDRQTWHCFGCSKHGDVFSFVMEKEHMEFPEVLRMFAEKTGVELKRGDVKLQNQKTKLYDIMEEATTWWHERLVSDEGKVAREYLHKRGITDDVIMSWQLGLAPESWDRCSQHLVTKGFTLADIIASGVVIERPAPSLDKLGRYGAGQRRGLPFYDRFRNRVMIPIRDHNGAVVGATGRIMPAASSQQPAANEVGKYVNTPETLIYNKGRILFALDRAKQAIKDAGFAVMVEGNMDAITSHAAGVTNVIAVSGTALTQEHAKLLHRYTETAALCFDEDVAGRSASRRGVDVLLQEGLEVQVVALPNGVKDPDECIQKDAALWRAAVEGRQSIFDALFARAKKRDTTDVREKKAIAKDLLSLIAKIPDAVERSHYIHALATLLAVPEVFLHEALLKGKRAKSAETAAEGSPGAAPDRHAMLSERLLALLMRFPDHAPYILREVTPVAVAVGPLRDLYTDIHFSYTQEQSLEVLAKLGSGHADLVDRLALAAEHFFGSFDRVSIAREVHVNVTELKRYVIREELTRIERAVQGATDDAASATLLARADELMRTLATFE